MFGLLYYGLGKALWFLENEHIWLLVIVDGGFYEKYSGYGVLRKGYDGVG
jgi:hypothetical protein